MLYRCRWILFPICGFYIKMKLYTCTRGSLDYKALFFSWFEMECIHYHHLPLPNCIRFQGCCNKILWTGWLKSRIDWLTILEAKNLKSRCQESHMPSEACRWESFLASSSFWYFNLWLFLVYTGLTPDSASGLPRHSSPCVSRPLHFVFHFSKGYCKN